MRDPSFTIDITESDARLNLQKTFDVEREAFAISSPYLLLSEFYEYHNKLGGRLYEGLEWLPEYLSARAEYESMKTLAREDLRYRQWIDIAFATKLGVRPNGVPLNDEEWKMVQALKGYVRVEDALGESPIWGCDATDEQNDGVQPEEEYHRWCQWGGDEPGDEKNDNWGRDTVMTDENNDARSDSTIKQKEIGENHGVYDAESPNPSKSPEKTLQESI